MQNSAMRRVSPPLPFFKHFCPHRILTEVNISRWAWVEANEKSTFKQFLALGGASTQWEIKESLAVLGLFPCQRSGACTAPRLGLKNWRNTCRFLMPRGKTISLWMPVPEKNTSVTHPSTYICRAPQLNLYTLDSDVLVILPVHFSSLSRDSI